MSSLYKAYGTDKALETGGRWFDINAPNPDKSLPGFLLARRSSGNTEFVAAVSRATRDTAQETAMGLLDIDADKLAMVTIFVDTVLKGWRHIFDEAGKDMTYSRDNAIKLFTDLPDLFSTLMEKSASLRNFQDFSLKDAAKN